jgi:glycosyltransferase involved in cell wall biosynthesis
MLSGKKLLMWIRAGIPKELIRTLKNPATRFSEDRIEAEIGDTFCFIGRVETGKGIAALCEAARIENVLLRVIGEGASRAGLQKRYPEVEFTGWVDQKSISQHLKGARAVVMPSHTPEPFGLVAAEATLSGLPIILSRQALLSEAVETFELGFVVVSTSPEDIADVLRKVATLPTDELRAISERGFNAEVSLSVRPENWLDHLLTLYRGAIQEARV